MNKDCVNIIGLVLNIIGTIILAFSLNAFLNAVKLSLKAVEIERLSKISHKPRLIITGTDNHLTKGEKKSNALLKFGITLVILGFILQLIPYFIKLK